MMKRIFDVLASGIGLVIVLPLLACISISIKIDSAGPVFFRQERVGQFGRRFRIHKFRTMVTDAERRGLQITVGRDSRVTRVGHLLRKYKLDELPQLIDVFLGKMSLVGPRPEVPFYVECYPPEARERILSVRPGITDWASILYKDESRVLGDAIDPQRAYIDQVLPIKIRYYLEYVDKRTFLGDIKVFSLRSSHSFVSPHCRGKMVGASFVMLCKGGLGLFDSLS